MVNNKKFCEIIERIAVKYAEKVEKHIENTREEHIKNVYDEVQLLGNITSTLERFDRINNGD